LHHVLNIQYGYLLNKYLKYSVWRLAVRYGIYVVRRQRVNGIVNNHRNKLKLFLTIKDV
jgi:hypothetical protein